MNNPVLLYLFVGILLALFWWKKTGWSSGGFVSPGLLALSLGNSEALIWCLSLALFLYPLLLCLSRKFAITGHERVAIALLCALVARYFSGSVLTTSLWIGWVTPALMASDSVRQGFFETFGSTVLLGIVTAHTMTLLYTVVA